MKNITLTVIGGGSVIWMRKLMKDVYMLKSADGGEIRLVDPMQEHARAVARMLERFNKDRNKHYTIRVIENRKQALAGADFVLCTFSPGRMDAFYNDLEIPIRYGIRQPVSMTVGPCGLSAALRTCPMAYDIVREMEEVCPGAVLLNVTNPMTAVTRAFNLAAKTVRVVGLCHEFHNLDRYVGELINLPRPPEMSRLEYLYRYLPEQGMDYTVAGINHFVWLTSASMNGRDICPDIRAAARERLRHPGNPGTEDIATARRNFAKFALCDVFGYMPLAGDRHLIEFLPSLCNQRSGWGMEFGVKKTTVAERINGKKQGLIEINETAEGKRQIDWNTSDEETTMLMDALLTGKTTVGIMNLPNRGQIANLPHACVVETLADVTPQGVFAPRPAGALPNAIASLCRQQLEISEMIVGAALEGDRERFVQALALDPLSADARFDEIPKLADELLFANRPWLDRFFDEGRSDHVSERDLIFYQ